MGLLIRAILGLVLIVGVQAKTKWDLIRPSALENQSQEIQNGTDRNNTELDSSIRYNEIKLVIDPISNSTNSTKLKTEDGKYFKKTDNQKPQLSQDSSEQANNDSQTARNSSLRTENSRAVDFNGNKHLTAHLHSKDNIYDLSPTGLQKYSDDDLKLTSPLKNVPTTTENKFKSDLQYVDEFSKKEISNNESSPDSEPENEYSFLSFDNKHKIISNKNKKTKLNANSTGWNLFQKDFSRNDNQIPENATEIMKKVTDSVEDLKLENRVSLLNNTIESNIVTPPELQLSSLVPSTTQNYNLSSEDKIQDFGSSATYLDVGKRSSVTPEIANSTNVLPTTPIVSTTESQLTNGTKTENAAILENEINSSISSVVDEKLTNANFETTTNIKETVTTEEVTPEIETDSTTFVVTTETSTVETTTTTIFENEETTTNLMTYNFERTTSDPISIKNSTEEQDFKEEATNQDNHSSVEFYDVNDTQSLNILNDSNEVTNITDNSSEVVKDDLLVDEVTLPNNDPTTPEIDEDNKEEDKPIINRSSGGNKSNEDHKDGPIINGNKSSHEINEEKDGSISNGSNGGNRPSDFAPNQENKEETRSINNGRVDGDGPSINGSNGGNKSSKLVPNEDSKEENTPIVNGSNDGDKDEDDPIINGSNSGNRPSDFAPNQENKEETRSIINERVDGDGPSINGSNGGNKSSNLVPNEDSKEKTTPIVNGSNDGDKDEDEPIINERNGGNKSSDLVPNEDNKEENINGSNDKDKARPIINESDLVPTEVNPAKNNRVVTEGTTVLVPVVNTSFSTSLVTIIEEDVTMSGMTNDLESTEPPGGGDNSGTIAAVVISCIGAVCLIALAVLLIIIRKRHKRFNYGQRCTPVSLDSYSVDNVSAYNSMALRRKGMVLRGSKRAYVNAAFEDLGAVTHPLNFAALIKFANNTEGIITEFEEIPQVTAQTNELPEGCEAKNRYANVIPLPETRVFLKLVENCPNSDYINANYIMGPKEAKCYYIACQAPMHNTVDDFWRMVWEQQSRVILMLTQHFENGIERSVDYLPPSEVMDCHRMFGDFQITLKRQEVKDKYIISILQLKSMVSNSWREVTHLRFLDWPEKGAPTEPNSLIVFLLEARSYLKMSHSEAKNEDIHNFSGSSVSPMVVHCSPGTGRTGTVIACDTAIQEFELTRHIDIPKIVYRIRKNRASSVQTKEQYCFIYKVISVYATKLTGGVLDSI